MLAFSPALEDPHGTISVVFSYIPFTSPIVMLIRIPFGVPIWEQILSLSVLIFSFVSHCMDCCEDLSCWYFDAWKKTKL